jgi:phosphoglycerate dehydrogenase-like enzyme
MNSLQLKIWCNNDFGPNEAREVALLTNGVGAHQLKVFDTNDSRDSLDALKEANVAFGYPAPEDVFKSDNIRWVQLNSAGYTSYDHDDIKQQLVARNIALTNSSFVFDEPCAQHLLAMITALARQLPAALDAQRGDKEWRMDSLRPASRLLNGQTVLMLGFGAIARRLVELLTPLHMNLIAVRRKVTGDEPIDVRAITSVDELLPHADHVVNILPANDETKLFLNSKRLSLLKPGAIVYNIGRGTTLDQDALSKELNAGRIAAAYIDVTDPEPLPPDHSLWTTPNCFITPHSGGGHSDEKERQVNHFLNNLRRFERGEELINRVVCGCAVRFGCPIFFSLW